MSERVIYLHVTQVRQLDHWLHGVRRMFDTVPYLVGSVLEHDRWRDIDVRMCLADEKYAAIPMLAKDLNMLVSLWGQQVTGLPIDFQVQSSTEWATFTGPRNARILH